MHAIAAILATFLSTTVSQDDTSTWVGPPESVTGCVSRLKQAGVKFRQASLPVHWNRSHDFQCGAPQVVRWQSGPKGVALAKSPKLSCPMALGMIAFEEVVQEEALRHLGRKVRRITHAGTYNCREMASYPGWVSEHSYANAIDISTFELVGGTSVSIARDYAAITPKGEFLRAIARRAYDEEIFAVVLTPNFDGLHRGHLHLDQARYRVDGT